LIVAGLHVPVMAGISFELTGSTGAVLFWHKGPIGAMVGLIFGATVISMDVGRAHCPSAGVKV